MSKQGREQLSEKEIQDKRDELNRVQLKYLHAKDVEERRNFILKEKLRFLRKINNLKNKGDLISNLDQSDGLIDKDFPKVDSYEDSKMKKQMTRYWSERIRKKRLKSEAKTRQAIKDKINGETEYSGKIRVLDAEI